MHYDPLDYSPYMIKADQGLRKIHNMLLKHQYDEAIGEVDKVIAEMRLAKAAMQDCKEHHR